MEPTHFSSFSQNFEFLTSVAIEKAMERDARTVFVTNLPLKVTDRELYRFFEKSGRVNDIRLIHDRNTRRSKGMGYVEYRDAGSIHKAQDKLSGRLLNGQSVVIAPTQAEKNHEALKEEILKQAAQVVQEEGPRTLYVGSLHAHIKERDLKLVFEPFGELDFINLHMDERTGQSKGYAFVQFTKPESAKAAFGRLNGLELAGSKIRVGLVKDMAAIDGGLAALEDEDAMGTIRMNAQSRALLMSKLQRSEADAALLRPPLRIGVMMEPTQLTSSFRTCLIPWKKRRTSRSPFVKTSLLKLITNMEKFYIAKWILTVQVLCTFGIRPARTPRLL
jgi:RNA-binding protein 39